MPGPLDERLVKAISHPIRHRVLVALNERVASPNELAQELGESLGRVSYHVRQLVDVGAIELVRTEPRRGAVEHYYRASTRAWFSAAEWARLPATTRRGILGENLKRIGAGVLAAGDGDGFDGDHAYASWTALDLDAEGAAEVSALLAETLARAEQIQAAAIARRSADGGSAPARTALAILHFERTPE